MKCQFGLLHTSGQPATADEVADLLKVFVDSPTETAGEVLENAVFAAFRGNQITPEENLETQPLDDGSHILTWDGRLDNREEMAHRAGLKHVHNIPDPNIVLKSYEAFGKDAFRDLIGEFALTLWCKRTRTLLFARSVCGARPLYYTLTNGTLYWSSDFSHLVRVSGVDREVNETYVLEYLITQPSTESTPFTSVCAVPANGLLEFVNGRMRQVGTLWDPTKIQELPYRSDNQYEEHCRQAITDAVRVRLRATAPVFAELSGGLDSSSIVLTADRILAASNRQQGDLQTISGVYEESKTCDESKFIRIVEERRGRPTLLVSEKEQRFTLGLDNPEFTGLPNPNHCSPGRYEAFAALVNQGGGRVLLTGLGGDHLFWSAPEGTPLVADGLRRGHIFKALRECRVWSQAARVPYPYLLLLKAVPLAIGLPFSLLETPKWLSAKMRAKLSTHKAAMLGNQAKQIRPSTRAQLFGLDLLFRSVGCGYFNEYKDLFVSHPYTHRPLVEFCLAASLSQFLRGGETRSLMRRALAERLPTKICRRVSKAGADEAYMRALQREWASNSDVRRWRVSELGFVNPAELHSSFERMHLGIQFQSGYLIRLVSMERWLRSLDSIRASRSTPAEKRALSRPPMMAAV